MEKEGEVVVLVETVKLVGGGGICSFKLDCVGGCSSIGRRLLFFCKL